MKVEVKNLKKNYGHTKVLKGIDLEFEEGKFYGLLGPNGAGKTTLFNLLIRSITQTSGDITWKIDETGVALKDVYQHLGVVFQQNNLDDLLTVQENLVLRGQLYGISKKEVGARIEEVNRYMDLTSILGKRYGQLSGGQKRKGDIARALIHNPSILLLDEPTTALDPKTRNELWDAIRFLNQTKGMTIILITHYLEEMESCDVLTILTDGRVRYTGGIEAFINQHAQTTLRIKVTDPKVLKKMDIFGHYDVTVHENNLFIRGIEMAEILEVLSFYHEKGWIDDFKVEKASLEGAYLNLLKKIESEGQQHETISE